MVCRLLLIHRLADPLLVARARGDDFNRNDFRLVVVMQSGDHRFDIGVLLLCCLDVADPFVGGLGLALPRVQARNRSGNLAAGGKFVFDQF